MLCRILSGPVFSSFVSVKNPWFYRVQDIKCELINFDAYLCRFNTVKVCTIDLICSTLSPMKTALSCLEVYRMKFVYNEEKIRAEHRIATTETELILFRGSKYIQSYTFDVLKTIVANCREEKYAIFGTPCQIYALNKWVTKKGIRDNFFFVDLYCHGCPSLHIWIKYQQYIKNKLHVNKFDQVIFRSKVRGWGMFYVVVVVVDGRPVFKSTPKEDGFYELFFSDQLLNDACNRCVLRRTHEYTDIRLGDFWGKKFLNNQRGVSAVSIVSERGVRLFDTIKKMDVFSTSCTYSDFLPYQSWGKVYNPNIDVRKALLGILESPNQTITDAVKELYRFQSIRQKVIRYIKYILAFFPLRVTNTIKKVL